MNLRDKFRTAETKVEFIIVAMSKDEVEFKADDNTLFWVKNIENAVEVGILEAKTHKEGYLIKVVKPETMFKSNGHTAFRINERGNSDWQEAK